MDATDAMLEAFGKGSAPLQTATNVAGGIERVRYTHDAVIDMIIARPAIKQRELAEIFGYTEGWLSRIINSDAFQARLAERKKDLVDPGLLASTEERFRAVAATSLEIIQEKLETTKSVDLALKAIDVSAKALGYGARQPQVAVNASFVVNLPEKAASQDAWIAKYGRVGATDAIPLTPELAQLAQGAKNGGN